MTHCVETQGLLGLLLFNAYHSTSDLSPVLVDSMVKVSQMQVMAIFLISLTS